MKLQRFETFKSPHLTVTCYDDLEVSGGREGELAIKVYGDEQDLEILREGERFSLTAKARCKIGCPQGTTLTVQKVSGDLRVRRLNGPVAIEQVEGNASLKDVGPTIVAAIERDLLVRTVHGHLSLDRVAGDLKALGLEGNLAAQVTGDVSLTADFVPGGRYQLMAGGDTVVRFSDIEGVRFQISAGGAIQHRVEWTELEEDQGELRGCLGAGKAQVEIESGGDVLLRSKAQEGGFDFSWDEDLDLGIASMAEDIERTIAAYMARMNARLETELSRLDDDFQGMGEGEVGDVIRHKAQQVAHKVRRSAERAAERARLRAEREQRRWERMSPPGPVGAASRGAAQPGDQEPVTEEERLMILKMVQEGKITAAQGAQLLEALEG